MVNLTADRRLGQNLGGLLEGCRTEEGFGHECRLGDTEQHRRALRMAQLGLTGSDAGIDLLVFFDEFGNIRRRTDEQ